MAIERNGRSPTRSRGAAGTRRRGPVGTTRREGSVGTHRSAAVGGGKGVFLFLLALVVVVAGSAAFALREDLADLLSKPPGPTPPVVDPAIKTPPVAPVVKTPPDQPVVKVPPDPPVVKVPPDQPVIKVPPKARDEEDALAAIAQGESSLVEGKFAAARTHLDRVGMMECKPETLSRAVRLAKRAAAFVKLAGDLTVSPLATEKTFRIKIRGRNAVEGFVEKQADGSYRIVQTDGKSQLTFTLKESQVESIEPVAPEEKRRRFLTELERRRGQIREATPVAIYDLAAFAWERALQREAAGEFARAYDLAEAKGEDLVLVVYNDLAGRLLGFARWYETVGREDWARRYSEDIVKFYPESAALADAKAILDRLNGATASTPRTFEVRTDEVAEKPPEPDGGGKRPIKVSRSDPEAGGPKVEVHIQSMGPQLAAADEAFKTGMEAYMEGLQAHKAGSNFVPKMREARRYFGKALPIYQKAAEAEPSNARLQKRAQEVGFYFHQSGRMLPL